MVRGSRHGGGEGEKAGRKDECVPEEGSGWKVKGIKMCCEHGPMSHAECDHCVLQTYCNKNKSLTEDNWKQKMR